MPKVKISEFSANPANNTDIDGINIAEGCAPSGINDAIRELMAQLKDWQSGTSNDPYVIGSSGSLTVSYGTANGVPYLNGSKVVTSGSALTFDGSQLNIPAGSAGTPSLSTIADPNTGIFFPAADTIAFAEGGVEAMRLDSSGNLGLGVTPSAWATLKPIQFAGGASLTGFSNTGFLGANCYFDGSWKYIATATSGRYEVAAAHKWFSAASGTAGNAISFTQAMTLDESGNLGIGTTSPAYKLQVVSGTTTPAARFQYAGTATFQPTVTLRNTADGNGYISQLDLLGQNAAGTDQISFIASQTNTSGTVPNLLFGMRVSGSYTERARIDSSGNLLVGVTSATARLTVHAPSGSAPCWFKVATNGDAGIFFANASNSAVGQVTVNSSSTAYVTSSDYRLKNTIAPMTGALDKVALLKPVTYKWNIDGSDSQGFIAHELAEVVPECVTGEKDAVDAEGNPQYQGIDTSFLVATLTAAIQEQQAIITALTARVQALESN
jgi:hypothetical protein